MTKIWKIVVFSLLCLSFPTALNHVFSNNMSYGQGEPNKPNTWLLALGAPTSAYLGFEYELHYNITNYHPVSYTWLVLFMDDGVELLRETTPPVPQGTTYTRYFNWTADYIGIHELHLYAEKTNTEELHDYVYCQVESFSEMTNLGYFLLPCVVMLIVLIRRR